MICHKHYIYEVK